MKFMLSEIWLKLNLAEKKMFEKTTNSNKTQRIFYILQSLILEITSVLNFTKNKNIPAV